MLCVCRWRLPCSPVCPLTWQPTLEAAHPGGSQPWRQPALEAGAGPGSAPWPDAFLDGVSSWVLSHTTDSLHTTSGLIRELRCQPGPSSVKFAVGFSPMV